MAQFLAGARVETARDPRRGRGVFAEHDIAAGTDVLREQPLALVVASAALCAWCTQPRPPVRCASCKSAHYCTQECRALDWRAGHDVLCAISPPTKAAAPELADDLGMYVKVAAALKQEPPQAKLFKTLESHSQELAPGVLLNAQQIAALLPPSLNNTQEVHTFLGRFQCNNFSLHDTHCFALQASGTFPSGSMFNHSCAPNCVTRFEGRDLVIRCVRDVPPGEELTIAYIDAFSPPAERRAVLRAKYFFECECARCSSPSHLDTSFYSACSTDKQINITPRTFLELAAHLAGIRDCSSDPLISTIASHGLFQASEKPSTNPGNSLTLTQYTQTARLAAHSRDHGVLAAATWYLYAAKRLIYHGAHPLAVLDLHALIKHVFNACTVAQQSSPRAVAAMDTILLGMIADCRRVARVAFHDAADLLAELDTVERELRPC